jgi:hypothetical protein
MKLLSGQLIVKVFDQNTKNAKVSHVHLLQQKE